MAESSPPTDSPDASGPDEVSVARWLVIYGLYLGAIVTSLTLLLVLRRPAGWNQWRSDVWGTLAGTSVAVKLLAMLLYVSVACLFLPLPTGGIVAAVATREAAVASGLSDSTLVVAVATALLVGVIGGIGSMMANLNDYHLITFALRSRRIGSVRSTKAYQAAERWFARSPFFLLVVFNILPLPVDVVRVLATSHRYPRLPFAAANLIGRFVRYAIIGFVTYWWNLGWIAVVALLGVGVFFGLWKALSAVRGRKSHRGPNPETAKASSELETETSRPAPPAPGR